jgi:meiosis induction protein kinase IME2/SME1
MLIPAQMAPHAMDAILSRPQWPASLAHLVTWCLMWDPKNRPTSVQAMNHEYFTDAVDPLRPRSSASRLLGRKQSHHEQKAPKESVESSPASTRSSWFRKSLIGRDSAPVVPQHAGNAQLASPRPSPVHSTAVPPVDVSPHHRPNVGKRATWTNGTAPPGGAPMPILPSIRPISPLSNSVTAQASKAKEDGAKTPKKIGRQLSVASHGNHYGQDGDRTLTGNGGLASPTSGQKESFFSHLRKRARRLSGRSQLPHSPKYDDIEANAGAFASNRSSMALDSHSPAANPAKNEFAELDKALRSVRYSLDASQHGPNQAPTQSPAAAAAALKRHHSFQQVNGPRPLDEHPLSTGPGPISSRTRRALQYSTHPSHRYETPDEEEELLDEALHGVHRAVRGIDRPRAVDGEANRNVLASKDANRLPPLNHSVSAGLLTNPYPTPSPSAKRNGVLFTSSLMDQPATPLSMTRSRSRLDVATWSTPPEENDWVASATQSIFAGSSFYR